jgi:hypothetical protein
VSADDRCQGSASINKGSSDTDGDNDVTRTLFGEGLQKRLEQVQPPPVSNGSIHFQVLFRIHGGSGQPLELDERPTGTTPRSQH